MNDLLSRFRTQLMGIGALGVLLVHSTSIIDYPAFLANKVGYGGTGVYIFVFLSAIGLYNSLQSRGEYSKVEFYKRRFIRTFLPYL